MQIASGLAQHSVVIAVTKKDRAAALQTALKAAGFQVHAAFGLHEAIKIIAQEMPSLVFTESLLTDGNAGNLYDKLANDPTLKNTPILVNVMRKVKEELQPLQNRNFVGFLLGPVEPPVLLAKVREIIGNKAAVSPHFVEFDKIGLKSDTMLSINGNVMGRRGAQIVVKADTDVDPNASLVCVPENKTLAPAVLRLASTVERDGQTFNLFPLNRVVGKGRTWLEALPDLDQAPAQKEGRKVLFFEPNQERFNGFQQVLRGYGFELVHAKSIAAAASVVSRDPEQSPVVYLHELTNDAGGIEWKKVYNALPATKRPILICGTGSLNAKSTPQMRFIRRPFGLGVLVEMLESAFASGALAQVGPKDQSLTVAGTPVSFQAQALVVGLDEIGGVLQTKFPLLKSSKLQVTHEFLRSAWAGDMTVTVLASQPAPGQADTYHVRFGHLPAGMSKTKYWEKMAKVIAEQAKSASQSGPEDLVPAG